MAVAAVIGREFDFTLLVGGVRFRRSGGRRRRGGGWSGEACFESSASAWNFTTIGFAAWLSATFSCRSGGCSTEAWRRPSRRCTPAGSRSHALALGLHFEEARVWAKAVAYLRQAGTQAAGRAGYREAVLAFQRALGALGHLPDHPSATGEAVDLRYELNDALVPLGEYREALGHLREAERLALALDDRARLARILSAICARLRIIGEHDGAFGRGSTRRRLGGLS